MASAVEHSTRIVGLDVFRGWAIAMMIVFHLTYDLAWFGFVDIDVTREPFWVYFRYVIVTIFTVGVGISLGIVHTPRIRWDRVRRRAAILGGAALVVTIATYIQSPGAWVYFGILHFIWMASLVGLVFLKRPWWALLGAVVILYGSYAGWLWEAQHRFYLWIAPLLHLPRYTEDLARFFPWFGAVLMGIAGYEWGWHRVIFSHPFFAARNPLNNALAFMGRHALVIYLIHLPVLYGVVWGYRLWSV